MMTPDHRKELISLIATLIWATLLTLLLATPYNGFMVIFLILVLLILTPIRMYKAPGRAMRLELARVAIWAVAVTIIFTVHHFRAAQWRETADRAAASIDEYMAAKAAARRALSAG